MPAQFNLVQAYLGLYDTCQRQRPSNLLISLGSHFENPIHTAGVAGSIPAAPTTLCGAAWLLRRRPAERAADLICTPIVQAAWHPLFGPVFGAIHVRRAGLPASAALFRMAAM